MPHISVIIPVFNRAHLVGRTIESILCQDFQDFDCLVVDDASSDSTVEIVQGYCLRDPRLKLVVNPNNLGLTRNWNRCLELAQSPLVQIMQSDDLIDSDYLGKAAWVFEKHSDLGLVAASPRYIDAEDRGIHPGNPRPPRYYVGGDEAVMALLTGGWPHVSSIIFRRECYKRLGGFDEKIWHGPDGELFTRFASQYDYYHFGNVHTSFRRHGSNMGNLEYLRDDFLEVDMYKKRLTWSYLSESKRKSIGIMDLDAYIAQDGARTALTGAIIMIAYGRTDLSRSYLTQALRLDRRVLRSIRFWKALSLNIVPTLGRKVMVKRIGINAADQARAKKVERSLISLAE